MSTREEFKEKVLKEYDRHDLNHEFDFKCHPGVTCFNKCCNDVNIFLTPYDIIRLKNRLGISSTEFIDKYTLIPIEENLRHPIIMLQMREDNLNCNFVGDNGCTVYEDRPWSCRMYPIGVASPKEHPDSTNEEFYFLIEDDVCHGFQEKRKISIKDWKRDQGVEQYDDLGKEFKEISMHKFFKSNKPIEPVKLEMFYMVCYDLDRFREFVFGSTFFKRFEIDSKQIEQMQHDDVELLRFGFKFLRFSLFGEDTMPINKKLVQQVTGKAS